MKKFIFALIALLLPMGTLSVLASPSPAQADDVTITATVIGSAIAKAEATSTAKTTGSSYAFAAAWAQTKVKVDKSKCFWSAGTNSYWSGGVFHTYDDPVPAYVCQLVHPVVVNGMTFTHKKMAGGTSGSHCGNLFIPHHVPTTTHVVMVLDVKAGTVAKVKVWTKVKVCVRVTVDVTLEYTYKGETHQVTKTKTASDCATATDSGFAKKRTTKQTTRHASAAAIAKAKARVETQAVAHAKAHAIAKAHAKAVASVSVTITIEESHDNPLVEVNAPAHVVINPNEVDATAHIWARVKASDGATVSVQTPQVTPQSLGTVSEWMQTGVDDDGWITYAGTFHASGQDGQVCFTVTVNDSKGGTATSQPACTQIVHDGGADV